MFHVTSVRSRQCRLPSRAGSSSGLGETLVLVFKTLEGLLTGQWTLSRSKSVPHHVHRHVSAFGEGSGQVHMGTSTVHGPPGLTLYHTCAPGGGTPASRPPSGPSLSLPLLRTPTQSMARTGPPHGQK